MYTPNKVYERREQYEKAFVAYVERNSTIPAVAKEKAKEYLKHKRSQEDHFFDAWLSQKTLSDKEITRAADWQAEMWLEAF